MKSWTELVVLRNSYLLFVGGGVINEGSDLYYFHFEKNLLPFTCFFYLLSRSVCMIVSFFNLGYVSVSCWDFLCHFLQISLAWPYFKMGKNQAYKAMQKARLGSSSSTGPVEIEDGMVCTLSHYYPSWVAFLETFILETSLSHDVLFYTNSIFGNYGVLFTFLMNFVHKG